MSLAVYDRLVGKLVRFKSPVNFWPYSNKRAMGGVCELTVFVVTVFGSTMACRVEGLDTTGTMIHFSASYAECELAEMLC
jgi:hypothetical protein